jgi:hypothetical protein
MADVLMKAGPAKKRLYHWLFILAQYAGGLWKITLIYASLAAMALNNLDCIILTLRAEECMRGCIKQPDL